MTSLYDELGGEPAVERLVARFYDHMDTRDDAAGIRAMHPADLARSRQRLFEFLSGWLGGPPLYIERHGHPRLRARHLPFPIDTDARDQWMRCMDAALDELVADVGLRRQLSSALARVADHMRNQPG